MKINVIEFQENVNFVSDLHTKVLEEVTDETSVLPV